MPSILFLIRTIYNFLIILGVSTTSNEENNFYPIVKIKNIIFLIFFIKKIFLITELIPASLLLYFGGKYSNSASSKFYFF